MTKFLDPSFSSRPASAKYRDNWEATFRPTPKRPGLRQMNNALPKCIKCGGGYDPSVDPVGYSNQLCFNCDPKKRNAHTCMINGPCTMGIWCPGCRIEMR